MTWGIGLTLILVYVFAVALTLTLEKRSPAKEDATVFDECKTVDEVAKKGPIEQPELDELLARMGKRGDVATAKRLATERMFVGSSKQAVANLMRLVD